MFEKKSKMLGQGEALADSLTPTEMHPAKRRPTEWPASNLQDVQRAGDILETESIDAKSSKLKRTKDGLHRVLNHCLL